MRGRRDALGSVLGLAVFFVGVGLLLLTFKLAYDMFSVDPSKALNLVDKNTIEIGTVGSTLTGLLIKVLLLIVMGLVSSLMASKGVQMYTSSRARSLDTEEVTVTKTEQKGNLSE
ncbi:MAG TPA: hypothetical protein VK934_08640 [Fimbriimonas sp.]|nr:hypothetical protein [Fimbriimonas sp.]